MWASIELAHPKKNSKRATFYGRIRSKKIQELVKFELGLGGVLTVMQYQGNAREAAIASYCNGLSLYKKLLI